MSAVIEVVPANLGHACELAVHMRKEDVAEVAAMGMDPYEAIRRSWTLSGGESWTMLVDGKTAAIGGVMGYGLLQGAGVIWLLTGNLVNQYPKAFWKVGKDMLRHVTSRYPYVTNLVDARYVSSIRWLRKLGFETAETVMINNVAFVRVLKRSE